MVGKLRWGLGCGLDVVSCGSGIVVNTDRSSIHSILRDGLGGGIDDKDWRNKTWVIFLILEIQRIMKE